MSVSSTNTLVDFEGYSRTYERANFQLRALARLLEVHKGVSCFARQISKESMEKLISNRYFLYELVNTPEFLAGPWFYIADHAMYSQESTADRERQAPAVAVERGQRVEVHVAIGDAHVPPERDCVEPQVAVRHLARPWGGPVVPDV